MTDGPDAQDVRTSGLLDVLCCLGATAILFGTGYAIWESVAENLHWIALALSLACYVAGFVVAFCGLTNSPNASKAAIVAVYFAFASYAASELLFKVEYYDSDAMLFNSYSAQLLLQGIDPYTQSLEPGYRIFGVPEGEVTPTVSGGAIYALSYPAMSFLIYVPFLWYGMSNLLWVDVLAHLAILALLIRAAPVALKPLASLLLFIDPSYFNYTIGGVTDVLWIPFGMLAGMSWRRNTLLAALWLGIACSFKQTPWLILPFAFIYWSYRAFEKKAFRALALPCAIAAGVFLLVNLPFIIWHPKSWLAGVMTPLSGKLVMFGSGIVQLQTAGIVPLSASLLSRLSLFVVLICVCAYALFPRRLSFMPFIAPGIAFFFAPRSLQNYFMYWPIVLAAYVFANWTADREDAMRERFERRRFAAVAALGAVALIFGLASTVRTPRTAAIRVEHAWISPVTDQVSRIAISVTNLTGELKRMRFGLFQEGDGVAYSFWAPKRQIQLAAGATGHFLINAPFPEAEGEVDPSNAIQIVGIQNDLREVYSPAVRLGSIPPKLQNARFKHWSADPFAYPISWNFSARDFNSGKLARARVAGRDAVRLSIKPGTSPWSATVIGQITDARPAKLRFALYPERDYSGGANPEILFGAELRDVLGHEFLYTIDSSLEWPQKYVSGNRIIWVLPGRLHHWNVVEADLLELRDRYGLALSPNATLLVDAVAAIRGRSPGTLTGFFGGIESLSSETSLVSLNSVSD